MGMVAMRLCGEEGRMKVNVVAVHSDFYEQRLNVPPRINDLILGKVYRLGSNIETHRGILKGKIATA